VAEAEHADADAATTNAIEACNDDFMTLSLRSTNSKRHAPTRVGAGAAPIKPFGELRGRARRSPWIRARRWTSPDRSQS
jgi:hypothetical protein